MPDLKDPGVDGGWAWVVCCNTGVKWMFKSVHVGFEEGSRSVVGEECADVIESDDVFLNGASLFENFNLVSCFYCGVYATVELDEFVC